MAVPTENLRTFDDKTLKESVVDLIFNTSPEDTPWLSVAVDSTAGNHIHQWQSDVLDTPSANNAALEGDEWNGTAANKPIRLDNRTQISRKEPSVSGTDQSMDGYGRGGMIEYQDIVKAVALKTDVETSMFQNGAKVSAADGVAGVSGGIETYLTSNVDGGGGAVEATGNGADARTPGTARDFNETLWVDALERAFGLGGNPDMAFMNAKKKTISNSFTGASTEKNLRVEGKRTINVVNFYETDFSNNMIAMIPSRHVRASSVIGIEKEYTGVAYAPGRQMVSRRMADTGDNEKSLILCEWSLETRSEAACFGIYDLN